jgi:hypothetical protein
MLGVRGELAIGLEIHHGPAREFSPVLTVQEIDHAFGKAPALKLEQNWSFAAEPAFWLGCGSSHYGMVECCADRHDSRLNFGFGRVVKPAEHRRGLLECIFSISAQRTAGKQD